MKKKYQDLLHELADKRSGLLSTISWQVKITLVCDAEFEAKILKLVKETTRINDQINTLQKLIEN